MTGVREALLVDPLALHEHEVSATLVQRRFVGLVPKDCAHISLHPFVENLPGATGTTPLYWKPSMCSKGTPNGLCVRSRFAAGRLTEVWTTCSVRLTS